MKKTAIYRQNYLKKNPWARKYTSSKNRSKRKNLEHTMVMADFKELWFRDKAWELDRPSIDRIDNKKGYVKENCRFIELSENIARESRGRKMSKEHCVRSSIWMKKLRELHRKLTDADVIKIKCLLNDKVSCKEIGVKFGVTGQNISSIKTGKIYGYIK
tara:strand:+ start:142 stop:618 length:477 start_codon:yes stop_codon:yes gene_type:complete